MNEKSGFILTDTRIKRFNHILNSHNSGSWRLTAEKIDHEERLMHIDRILKNKRLGKRYTGLFFLAALIALAILTDRTFTKQASS